MEKDLHQQFIGELERKYGPWEELTSQFGTSSYGDIAKDLCISASQFSKLISGTATQGMYLRSIDNIALLLKLDRLEDQRKELLESKADLEQELRSTRKGSRLNMLWMTLLAFLLGGILVYWLFREGGLENTDQQAGMGHPLSQYFDAEFDADFDSPYLDESEVQSNCPCSAYEGTWSLSGNYKLPLPGNRKPGVYYLAKSADVRMKCSKSDRKLSGKSNKLQAFEYLVNEIWVDLEQTPLSPRYFDKERMAFTEAFNQLNLEDQPQFKKLATIHSFFISTFTIYSDSIVRNGEPAGRFATEIDEQLATEFEINLKHILENVIGDLVTTDCQPADNPYCDPNELREGESIIGFNCYYTISTENLGMNRGYPYRKAYRLEEQNYSANLECGCGDY